MSVDIPMRAKIEVSPCLARTKTGTQPLIIVSVSTGVQALSLEGSQALRVTLEEAEKSLRTALALTSAQQDLLAARPEGAA